MPAMMKSISHLVQSLSQAWVKYQHPAKNRIAIPM
jgi:hypothetical protein